MSTVELIYQTDFILLEAHWPAAYALGFFDSRAAAAAVIVHRFHEGKEYFYVYALQEAWTSLNLHRNELVERVLDLHEWRADKVVAPGGNVSGSPSVVVMDEGRVVGYLRPGSPVRGAESQPSPPASIPVPGEGGEPENPLESLTPKGEGLLRTLYADFPPELEVGTQAVLSVYLTPAGLEEALPGLTLAQPAGTLLDVVVQARRGLEVDGSARASLTIGAPDEFDPLRFTLRAVEAGQGDVRVIVFREGAVLGYLKLLPVVTVPSAFAPAGSPAGSPHVANNQHLSLVQVGVPDLSLHIEEVEQAGRRGFVLYLSAADPALNLNLRKFGPVFFQTDPGPYFSDFFRGIEGLPNTSLSEQALAARQLETQGVFLFENLFPPDAQSLLWSLKDQIKSIFIQSSEPWVPWELCRLTGTENGRKVEGAFFCEAFEMTRWLPGTGLKPTLHLSNMAVVMPSSSGLPYTAPELQYLLGLASLPTRRVQQIPAHYLDLFREFTSGTHDGWHFSGHGAVRSPDPNRTELLLDGQETLTPLGITGVAANLGQATPLVFLNACQAGAGGMSLTDTGGWARQFLAAGAGAFIGAHWSIYDHTAFAFTKELYGRLLAGLPVGRAVRESRMAVKPAGDSTWLAYTVFAHPLASVQS
jgi:hypothetical protein